MDPPGGAEIASARNRFNLPRSGAVCGLAGIGQADAYGTVFVEQQFGWTILILEGSDLTSRTAGRGSLMAFSAIQQTAAQHPGPGRDWHCRWRDWLYCGAAP